MKLLIVYWIGINAIAFAVTARDKRNARLRLRRVPEIDILMLAAMGGAAGEWLAMLLFRHKTRKARFAVGVPVMLALQAVLILLLVLSKGGFRG